MDRSGAHFAKAPKTDKNPVRGFYHVYTYDITEKEVEEDWIWSLQKDERLALVLLDIGKCAHRALFDEELAKTERIFSLFRENGMQMIVRVVYDRVGRGMEQEPEKMEQVMAHMRQLGPLFAAFSAHILTVQGLFVGSWGEMHGSKFLDREALICLYDTLRESVGDVSISVRRPQYQRILRLHNKTVGTGLYDDAILASGTDMGTFGWIDDVENPDIMWAPKRELEFMQVQNTRTLCGGEVLSGALSHSGEEVLARLQMMHVTYLNSVHEPVVWERWRTQESPVCANHTLYDEIRARLGYRYELEEVALCAEGRLEVTVKNSGFACCYDAVRMIIACGRAQCSSVFDGRSLASGKTLHMEFDISELCCAQGGEELVLCVALRHEKTGLPIYFADGCDDSDLVTWERYRSMSSLPEGIAVGVLSREKVAIS